MDEGNRERQMGKAIGDIMGLEVGQRQYDESAGKSLLRSLSTKRAWIIRWQRLHPNAHRIFERADRATDKCRAKIYQYNETIYSLKKRIDGPGKAGKLHLIASLARVCSLKAEAEKRKEEENSTRNRFAAKIYEFDTELPRLDEEIAEARGQRPR